MSPAVHTRRLVAIVCGLALWLLAPPASHASRLTVYNLNDAFAGSLRQAVLDSSPGDTILFAPSLFGGVITLSGGAIPVSHDVTILGPQEDLLTVAGSTTDRLFSVSFGTLTVSGLTLGPSAAGGSVGYGGLIECGGVSTGFSASDCVLTQGLVQFGGGLIHSSAGSVVLARCTLSGAATSDVSGLGGAIECSGPLTVTDCLFRDNTANAQGGAVYATGTTSLTRCTFHGNSAGSGGAVCANSSICDLFDCTITGNYAPLAGGVYNASNSSLVGLGNCIVASNQPPDVGGAFDSFKYNAIGDADGSTGLGYPTYHDQVGTGAHPLDPGLGPLQDNGGPTWTQSPLPGSLVIDQGASGSSLDARGHARTYDNPGVPNAVGGIGTDVGAVEVGPATHWQVTNLKDSGAGSFRQATITAAPGDSVTFLASLFGTIPLTSGEIFVKRGMRIAGPGPNVLAVDAGYARPAIRVTAGATGASLSALALLHGAPPACLDVAAGATLAADLLSVTDSRCPGIENDGALTLIRSLIARCNAYTAAPGGSLSGGGLFNSSTGSASLVNCTFAADSALNGGAILNQGGTLDVRNCTIVGNMTMGNTSSTRKGGGILCNSGGATTLTSTLVAGNTAVLGGPDLLGAFASGGYNLLGIGDGSTGFTNGANQDQVGTGASPIAAGLGPLADNGGPTATLMPQAGSPAIDRGLATGLTTDQRLRARKFDDPTVANAAGGDASDVGACERGGGLVDAPPPPPGASARGVRIDAVWPNPIVAGCGIRLWVAEAGPADLALYDVAGRRVATLFHGRLDPGPRELRWNGNGIDPSQGGGASSTARARPAAGVFWLRFTQGTKAATRELVWLR